MLKPAKCGFGSHVSNISASHLFNNNQEPENKQQSEHQLTALHKCGLHNSVLLCSSSGFSLGVCLYNREHSSVPVIILPWHSFNKVCG